MRWIKLAVAVDGMLRAPNGLGLAYFAG